MSTSHKPCASLERILQPADGWMKLGSLFDGDNFGIWYRPLNREIVCFAGIKEHREVLARPDDFEKQLRLLNKFYGGTNKQLFG